MKDVAGTHGQAITVKKSYGALWRGSSAWRLASPAWKCKAEQKKLREELS
jgi:hypothetical protein